MNVHISIERYRNSVDSAKVCILAKVLNDDCL